MKEKVIYVMFFMFFNHSHPFKIKIEKCKTEANTKGFCRKEIECVGSKEPLIQKNCQQDYVCCPMRDVSRAKCYEYSKAVFGQGLDIEDDPENEAVDECGILARPLIVGGTKANLKEFPHMAALGFRKTPTLTYWECGGSLISELYIMTAAHCISKKKIKWYVIKLGAVHTASDDARYVQERTVEEAIIHPRYRAFLNDIALLKMNKAVKFTPYVRPLCLDYKGDIVQDKVIAIGFGYTNYGNSKGSPDLLKVVLDLIDKKDCNGHWKSRHKNGVPDSKLCAGSVQKGRDTCLGDSGGPLQTIVTQPYCMYRVVGITSLGLGCGQKNSYNLYTRVFWFIPWIESIVWPGEK